MREREREREKETIEEVEGGFLDLLLAGGSPVGYERVLERRHEIDAIYENMVTSDLVIITLGLIEGWFDRSADLYLNRMPGGRIVKKNPDRYRFHQLSVVESLTMLDTALHSLINAGVQRILLTVSPVPLGKTFTEDDAVTANGISKSVLRVSAHELASRYPQIDYFPSFEIVSSGGMDSFTRDNIHVENKVVATVTEHMISSYFPDLSPVSRV